MYINLLMFFIFIFYLLIFFIIFNIKLKKNKFLSFILKISLDCKNIF